MVEVSTSILTVEKKNIMKTIYNLEVGKTDYFHIDVMDGKFVEAFTSSIMEEYCGYVKSVSTIPLDVHLMVKDVKKYVDIYSIYEPSIITFHVEAVKNDEELMELINYIKENDIDLSNSAMWVSTFKRARETADIINQYLGIEKVTEDYILVEQQYGLFSDKDIETIRELYPEQFAYYDQYYQNGGRFYPRLPQGESPFSVALRTRLFLETVFRGEEDVLFVVSHGATIKTIVMNFFHYSPEWYDKELTPANCSIRLIESNKEINSDSYIYNPPKPKILKK